MIGSDTALFGQIESQAAGQSISLMLDGLLVPEANKARGKSKRGRAQSRSNTFEPA